MNLTTKESPLPPSTMDVFLFFCNREEQLRFIDYADAFPGIDLLDKGELESEDKQECSIHGRGSHATNFVLIQMQKSNFGRISIPAEVGSDGNSL
jgi:hypothetical protein